MTKISSSISSAAPPDDGASHCPVTGLPLFRPKNWVLDSLPDNYRITLTVVGRHILLLQPSGYLTAAAFLAAAPTVEQAIAHAGQGEKSGYVFLEDYSNVRGSSHQARKLHIDFFKRQHQPRAGIIFGAPPLFQLSYKLAVRLHLVEIPSTMVKKYAEAVKLAVALLADEEEPAGRGDKPDPAARPGFKATSVFVPASLPNPAVPLRPVEPTPIGRENPGPEFERGLTAQETKKYTEQLLGYIARIDWEKDGFDREVGALEAGNPFGPVFNAIAFIKADLDALFREKSRAEAEIAEYQKQLRKLGSEILLAEEKERRRIANQLHDHTGQSLAMARIKLQWLAHSLGPSEHSSHIREVVGILDEAIQDARTLTLELSPPVLYELGLTAGLEWLVEQTQEKYGLETIFVDSPRCPVLPVNMSILAFRAVRELLINVVKHAQASRVVVAASFRDENLVIRVEDDGIGFEPPAPGDKPRGFGLFSIRERFDTMGGRLEIESSPGQGCRALLIIPT
ncbi:MAG: sensor histidine kinase [Pseudomonadota bacterium]